MKIMSPFRYEDVIYYYNIYKAAYLFVAKMQVLHHTYVNAYFTSC